MNAEKSDGWIYHIIAMLFVFIRVRVVVCGIAAHDHTILYTQEGLHDQPFGRQ